MSASFNFIVIFPIYGYYGTIQKQDSRCILCKTYIFIRSNLLSYKNWKQSGKICNTAFTLLLWVKVPFLPRNAKFLKENAEISKIKAALLLQAIFSKTTYLCALTHQMLCF